jgi:hypothetical protein
LRLQPACYNTVMKQTRKILEPREETRKKMRPITRDTFTAIVNKAIKTPSRKPAPKSN